MQLDGVDLLRDKRLWLAFPASREVPVQGRVGKSVRIGITKAADRLLRFYERGNPFVSGPKGAVTLKTPRSLCYSFLVASVARRHPKLVEGLSKGH